MKRWATVMALALAIGLMSAPISVYADSHEAGEETSDNGGGEGNGGDEGNGGGEGACGGGDAKHEGSH
jgi:hypothetical protein